MKKIILGIAAIAALAIAYWLISPLFIDKTVNEALPTERDAEVDQAIETYKENIEAQVPPEKMAEFKAQLKTMLETPDVVMEEALPDPTEPQGPVVIAAGSFIDVAHEGSGDAKFIYLGDAGIILRIENLDVLNGPDLRVVLSKNKDVMSSGELGEYIELGKLKGNKGTQNYELPSSLVVSDYHSVIIYCKPFHVVFNSATLVQ